MTSIDELMPKELPEQHTVADPMRLPMSHEMPRIRILPEGLSNKIAAGEVVERPASVVKELIENAIDANATKIEIHIEKSGLKKIEVRDNGVGMDKGDIRKCFEIHTTSKTLTEKDLLAITSLGFRGEALASIASISNLTIKSKPTDKKLGTQVEVTKGKLQKETKIGMPTGTIVIVENPVNFEISVRVRPLGLFFSNLAISPFNVFVDFFFIVLTPTI